MAQQENTKALVPKRISYRHSFEKYIEKFMPSFSIDDVEKFDLFANKNSKYLFYKFNDEIEGFEGEKRVIRHTVRLKNSISVKKIEERFLDEKIISGVEFNDLYENSIEKKTKIIEIVESNYKISRRVYQSVFADVADIFIEYIYSLDQDEISERNEDLKFNGQGANHISEIENSYGLLTIFQRFYYYIRRLPLKNGLLVVPDVEVLERTEKINLKNLNEMYRDTNSHDLVSC